VATRAGASGTQRAGVQALGGRRTGSASSAGTRVRAREWRDKAEATPVQQMRKKRSNCAGVPTVSQRHTRMGSEGLTREQEDLEVRGGFGVANPFGSIISSQGSTTFSSSYPRGSLSRYHHESPRRLFLRPFSNHYNPWRASSSLMESRHRRALLVANSVHLGNSLSACSPS
jgi:hypothetical protein